MTCHVSVVQLHHQNVTHNHAKVVERLPLQDHAALGGWQWAFQRSEGIHLHVLKIGNGRQHQVVLPDALPAGGWSITGRKTAFIDQRTDLAAALGGRHAGQFCHPFGQILVDFSDCNNFTATVDSQRPEFHDLVLDVTKIVGGSCP